MYHVRSGGRGGGGGDCQHWALCQPPRPAPTLPRIQVRIKRGCSDPGRPGAGRTSGVRPAPPHTGETSGPPPGASTSWRNHPPHGLSHHVSSGISDINSTLHLIARADPGWIRHIRTFACSDSVNLVHLRYMLFYIVFQRIIYGKKLNETVGIQ